MQILWFFFIMTNLFCIFYFDENVFYFVLFSILFLPNFFNNKINTMGQISVFQYLQYLRDSLNYMLTFFESTKRFMKRQLLTLFKKLNDGSGFQIRSYFISLCKLLTKQAVVLLKKRNLNQNIFLLDSFFLLFFKNNVNFFNIFEKKKIIANFNANANANKTDVATGRLVLKMLNSNYKNTESKNVLSLKNINEIFTLLNSDNKNKK